MNRRYNPSFTLKSNNGLHYYQIISLTTITKLTSLMPYYWLGVR